MKAFLILSVSCDGGRLGHLCSIDIRLSKESADERVKELTKPIQYHNKLEEFKEDSVGGIQGWACWRATQFVYVLEKDLG